MGARINDPFKSEPFVKPSTKLDIGLFELNSLDRFRNNGPEPIGSNGLFQEIECSQLHRFDSLGDGRMACHHDRLTFRQQLSRHFQQLHAIYVIHNQICDHDIKRILFQLLLPLGAASRNGAPIACLFQAFGHCLRMRWIVVDDKN